MEKNLLDIFGESGLLSKKLSHFQPREVQQRMADAIDGAIQTHEQLVVEAGTGTGKTFAYLVPLFLSQKKVIISTGTTHLQDQLFHKDIPVIRDILAIPKRILLLKGRANYLCLHRLEKHRQAGLFTAKKTIAELEKVAIWSGRTKTGDIAELSDIETTSAVWPTVTSTSDNCLHQECPLLKKCFLAKARQEALRADILVVNHHLFFADMALKEEGFGELLPGAEIIVFDEAHLLPEIASQFFSISFSSRQLIELIFDIEAECTALGKDVLSLFKLTDQLRESVNFLRLGFGAVPRRAPWKGSLHKHRIDAVKECLAELHSALATLAVRSQGLANVWHRTAELSARFAEATGEAIKDHIHWFETFTKNFMIYLTPLSIASSFQKFLNEKPRCWIFTSATLSVHHDFKHFVEEMGLDKAKLLQLESPFHYPTQALLYVPRDLPNPNATDYLMRLIDAVVPVLRKTKGRAFFLFTSHRALQLATELLPEKIDYPILVQGQMPKLKLVEAFCEMGNAILLGTGSFWQGVDVRGDALSCVIIDRLPFASPDDPVLQARMRTLTEQGKDPFNSYQLPKAVIALKQGAGRLIRDYQDRGVLIIGDPRLVSQRYGRIFWQSLPNMTRTRDLQTVCDFFEEPHDVVVSD